MNKVIIRVKSNPKKIIKKLRQYNIRLLNIEIKDDYLYFKTYYDDYIMLKSYLPYYDFEVVHYYGKKNIFNILKKYQYYFIAFIIGVILLLFISNIIIEVNVIHSSKKIRNLVIDALEDYGIERLSFKKNYDELNKIKNDILEKHKDDLEWMEIEVHGMKYVIRVQERIINKETKPLDYCHIVAQKSGVVTDILTKKGESLVTRNTYVNKGDILISGDIKYNEEVKQQVCAKGEVKAEVWYTVNVNMPLNYQNVIKTGKKKINFAYDKGLGKTYLFKNKYKKSFNYNKKIFSLLGVSFYKVTEYETKTISHKYKEEDAVKQAILIAMEKINIKKRDKDKIITQKVLKKSINDSTISLEVFFAVEEEIGKQEIRNRDGEVS